MKARKILFLVFGLLFAAAAIRPVQSAPGGSRALLASTTRAFTYQGLLRDGGNPANGTYDFTFVLYDAAVGGWQAGPVLTRNDVAVARGLFTVTLDFGDVFHGPAYFLEISVRPGASTGAYTPLVPRQALTAAPYASGLVLPLDSTVSTSGSAFAITNDGSGESARFSSASNAYSVLIENTGTGGGLRINTSSAGVGSALYAYNYGLGRYGIEAENLNASSPYAAIYARTAGLGQAADFEINSNTTGDALFARTTSSNPGSFAGIFVGNVSINGNLAKSAGTFKIDHPLDPANKYLQHSFVESPDMMNIYNGNVILDANGEAAVTLPDYFEALNMEFRYQLTPIGGSAPDLYIAQEVQGNQFRIAGGSPGLKVSWQVTGIRQDPYAEANRIQVEVDKPQEERGTYIHPTLYGQPASLGLDRLESPLEPQALPQDEK